MTRRRPPLRRRRRELGRRAPPPQSRLDEAPDEILDRVEGGLVRASRVALGLAAHGLHRRLRRREALGRISRLFARHWFDRHARAVIRDRLAHLPPGAFCLGVAPTLNGARPRPWRTHGGGWSFILRGDPPGGHMPGGPPVRRRARRVLAPSNACCSCSLRRADRGTRPLEYAVWTPLGRFRSALMDLGERPLLRFMCAECFFGDEIELEPDDSLRPYLSRYCGATDDYAPEVRYVPCARDHRAHRAPIAWRPATGLRPPRPLFPAAPRQN